MPVGTVYVVNRVQADERGSLVLSYGAQGVFRQAWGWGVADEERKFERCGPDGEAAHPTCKATGSPVQIVAFAGEGAGQMDLPEGVAVDQTTGDVYVFNGERKKGAVQVFTATGEPVGGFGEDDLSGTEGPISESPEKFHKASTHSRIAVDDAGTVYVADFKNRIAEWGRPGHGLQTSKSR